MPPPSLFDPWTPGWEPCPMPPPPSELMLSRGPGRCGCPKHAPEEHADPRRWPRTPRVEE